MASAEVITATPNCEHSPAKLLTCHNQITSLKVNPVRLYICVDRQNPETLLLVGRKIKVRIIIKDIQIPAGLREMTVGARRVQQDAIYRIF